MQQVDLGLEEVYPGTILVVSDRSFPLVVPAAIEGLSIESDLEMVDVGGCPLQLVSGNV